MISFKGAHFPEDVILYAVFFYVQDGVSYRDLGELWKKEALKSITPHSIAGLLVNHHPWLWSLKRLNALLLLRGEWMKRISKLKVRGFIYTAPLTSRFPRNVMKRRLPPFSINQY